MKISITTERELSEEDFWDWASATINALNRIANEEDPNGDLGLTRLTVDDFKELWKEGRLSFADDLGYTKVKTTYRLEKGE